MAESIRPAWSSWRRKSGELLRLAVSTSNCLELLQEGGVILHVEADVIEDAMAGRRLGGIGLGEANLHARKRSPAFLAALTVEKDSEDCAIAWSARRNKSPTSRGRNLAPHFDHHRKVGLL